jgi:TIGR03009 family protein
MRWIMAIVLTSAIGFATAESSFGQGQGQGRGQGNRPAGPGGGGGMAGQGQEIDPAGAVPPRVADAQGLVAKMNELLRQWEEQSSKITTLDAQFTREDVLAAWQTKELYVGRAILKSPDLVFLDFQKVENNKKVPYEQIRCTGKEVYHLRSANSQIFIYPMPAQADQRALQEGPLPFLFNMRAADAKQRYFMTLKSETLTTYVIQIKPRQEIDREAFIQADVLLDKQKFLPTAMRLYAPNGKDYQTYKFTGEGCWIKPNAPVNETNFEPLILKGWQVIRNPDGKGGAPGSNAVGAQAPPARRGPAAVQPSQAPPRR